MAQPFDVGTTIAGRYKLTGQVQVSPGGDYVFDGVDQTLSRKVSVLVPAPEHAESLAHNARQVAIGERSDPVQVLDLGTTSGQSWLVANRTGSAALLGLFVDESDDAAEPEYDADAPFDVERDDRPRPVSSGMFDHEDEPDDDIDEDFEDEILGGQDVDQDDKPAGRIFGRWGRGRSRAREADNGDAGLAAGAGVAAAGAAGASSRGTDSAGGSSGDSLDTTSFDAIEDRAPWRDQPEAGGTYAQAPETDPELNRADPGPADTRDANAAPGGSGRAAAAGAVGAGGLAAGAAGTATAATGAAGGGSGEDIDPFDEYDAEEPTTDVDDQPNDPRFSRVLVWALVSILLIGGVVVAVTQLGTIGQMFTSNSAERNPGVVTEQEEQTPPQATGTPAPPPPEPPAPPVIAEVTREMTNNQFAAVENLDRLLPLLHDGNEATDWFSPTYSNANFAGLSDNLALVSRLEEPTKVSRVDITQRGGSGGSFQVLTNDQPTLDGAKEVATGSFTSPQVSVPLPADTPETQYVIINFTELPRVSSGQYPFGLRIAEIKFS